MVKPLTFKGDKPKKRKHHTATTTTSSSDQPSKQRKTSSGLAGTGEIDDTNAEDTSWVSADTPSDISGPVLIVLPTEPPTCLATDAHGKVFASELENLIEGDATGMSAEPHDVRQVWVATKVAGTEGFSLKGFLGKYLSCDKYGILSATSAAISHHESFLVLPRSEIQGTFTVQTGGGDTETFLCAREGISKTNVSGKTVDIRGDESKVGFETTIRIRMQAKFKPRIKASKETKLREKISQKELEAAVGRSLEEHEVKRLRRARKEGNFHEEVLDVRVKGKHDKFA